MADHVIKFTADASKVRKEFEKPFKVKIDDSEIKKTLNTLKNNYQTLMGNARVGATKYASTTGAAQEGWAGYVNEQVKGARENKQMMSILQPGEGGQAANRGTAGAALTSFLARKVAPAYLAYKAYSYLSGATARQGEIASQYMQFRGMGSGMPQVMSAIGRSSRYGMSGDEGRSLAGNLLQGTGSFHEGLFNDISKFSKAYGVDSGMLGNIAGTIRQTGATGDDLQRKNSELLASAINSHIEKGRIGEYLQTTADLLEKFSSNNFGSSSTSVSAMMGMLSKGGGVLTPRNTASILGGIDSLMKNPGSNAPLMYNTIAQTLKQGGFDSKKYGGMGMAILAASQSGLSTFDVNEQNYPYLAKNNPKKFQAMQALGKSFDPVNFLKNYATNLNKVYGKLGPYGDVVAGKDLPGGFRSLAEFTERVKSKDFTPEEAKKMIAEMGPQTDKNLGDVVKSIEGQKTTLTTISNFLTEKIGSEFLGVSIEADKAIIDIKNAIVPLLKPASTAASTFFKPFQMQSDPPGWKAIKSFFHSGGGGSAGIPSSYGPTSLGSGAVSGLGFLPGVSDIRTKAGVDLGKIRKKAAILTLALGLGGDLVSESDRGKYDDVMHGSHGSPTSAHKSGLAADISIAGMSWSKVQEKLNFYNSFQGLKAAYHPKGYFGATANHIHIEELHQRTKTKMQHNPNDVGYSEN